MQLTQLQLQTLTLYFGSPCERLYIERERQVFMLQEQTWHNRLNIDLSVCYISSVSPSLVPPL